VPDIGLVLKMEYEAFFVRKKDYDIDAKKHGKPWKIRKKYHLKYCKYNY